MRRMHWWGGAAAGVGMPALAATGAPAAFAAHEQPATTQHVAVTPVTFQLYAGPKPVHGKHHDDHHGHHPKCPYPPHGKPDVWIDASRNHVHPDTAPITISGAMRVNGCGYDKFIAGLYKLIKGPHHHDQWVQIGTGVTGAKGAITFSLKPTSTEDYRVMTAAGNGLDPGWSNRVTVEFRNEHH